MNLAPAFDRREWTNVEQQRAANRFAHALADVEARIVVLVGGAGGGRAWPERPAFF